MWIQGANGKEIEGDGGGRGGEHVVRRAVFLVCVWKVGQRSVNE